jgi:hypothetical protein
VAGSRSKQKVEETQKSHPKIAEAASEPVSPAASVLFIGTLPIELLLSRRHRMNPLPAATKLA